MADFHVPSADTSPVSSRTSSLTGSTLDSLPLTPSQSQDGAPPKTQRLQIDESCWAGRIVSRRTRLTGIMTIFAVVGAILLLFGVLALAGYMGQGGKLPSFLQHIHRFTSLIAAKTATNVLNISIFAITVGGTCFVAGGITLVKDVLCNKPVQPGDTVGDHENL